MHVAKNTGLDDTHNRTYHVIDMGEKWKIILLLARRFRNIKALKKNGSVVRPRNAQADRPQWAMISFLKTTSSPLLRAGIRNQHKSSAK
jgi:hypothetical protein